jgi:hypothetical protein
MSKQLLFKVKMVTGEHEYKIYTNGEIEGFGEGALVFNHFPSLLIESLVHQHAPQEDSLHPALAQNT